MLTKLLSACTNRCRCLDVSPLLCGAENVTIMQCFTPAVSLSTIITLIPLMWILCFGSESYGESKNSFRACYKNILCKSSKKNLNSRVSYRLTYFLD